MPIGKFCPESSRSGAPVRAETLTRGHLGSVAMQRIVADLEPAPHLPHGVLTGSVVGGGRIKCDHRGKSADVYGA